MERGEEEEEEEGVLASRLEIAPFIGPTAVVATAIVASFPSTTSPSSSLVSNPGSGGASDSPCPPPASAFGCGSAGLIIARYLIKL